ncbi:ThiF family adenylyltransferase [Actinosynnema sp. CA-248983]
MTVAAVELAAAQLTELETLSGGALAVLDQPGEGDADFVISMDTGVAGQGAGIRVRTRERFRIRVSATFPYEPPAVYAEHRRWKDSPHVNWGNLLCLYAAPAIEWAPADGMRGLVERLLMWLERAAEGTLDPDGRPLHPPVAFPTTTGCLVVEPSLGDRVPWSGAAAGGVATQFAWCVRHGSRVDVVAWLSEQQLVERVNQAQGSSVNPQGLPYFIALAVLVSSELWWEYPNGADQLAEGLAGAGYPRERLLADLALVGQANHILRRRSATPDAHPVVVLVGTPSRRIEGDARLAHLVAWKLGDYGEQIVAALAEDSFGAFTTKTSERLRGFAREWLRTSVVRWMSVYDQRRETTRRRDQDTAISWLRDRRVLILGCGALGAPVAEYCVRAGSEAVTVVDNGYVAPGILVRQPYRDHDIGNAKAGALADRLNAITRKPRVRGVVGNAVTYLLDELDAGDFDLIVDATANSGVRAAVEQTHRHHAAAGFPLPPTVMMIIGHRSDLGLVTVSTKGATGTGHDVLRRVLLDARRAGTQGWQDVLADFFPDPPRADLFFPEPGCSAPTFVGSAADVSALAASMLTEVTRILAAGEETGTTMTAVAVRGPSAQDRPNTSPERLAWPNDLVVTDSSTGYDVRLSAHTMAEIRAEARRGARVRGPRIETGGMLLGSVDEATGVVSVDIATGPSPDSKLSSGFFFHGTAGTQEILEHHSRLTGGAIGFLGIWHTHPGGPARPSPMDEAGMSLLTSFSDVRRALMVIIGGAPATWQGWIEDGVLPDIHVEMIEPGRTADLGETRAPVEEQVVPFGEYLPGGFSAPDPRLLPRRRRRWAWWRRV